jgi:hypothetical protein
MTLNGLRQAGRLLLRTIRALSQSKEEQFPITEEPYRTGDPTDPYNSTGRLPDDRAR